MKSWFAGAACLLYLSGCASLSPAPEPQVAASVTPMPLALFQEPPETPAPQRLNQPPAPRAKDLAPPDPPPTPPRAPRASPTKPSPAKPQALKTTPRGDSRVGLPPSHPKSRNSQPAPKDFSVGSSFPPPTRQAPRPPFDPRPTTSAAVHPRPHGPHLPRPLVDPAAPPRPARPSVETAPSYPTASRPHHGHGPSPLSASSSQQRQSREQQLQQDYLQARADALNLKYHRGRPVYHARSPEVQFSASAPPTGFTNRPSIPGAKGDVVGAFRQSEVKRQEWQNFRNQPPQVVMPQPMAPAYPQPARPPLPGQP